MAITELTNSEMGCFRTCPAKWGFEYPDMLRPLLAAKVLTWGNTIHAGVEGGYIGAFAVERGRRLDAALVSGEKAVDVYHAEYLKKLDEAAREGMPDEVAQERFEDAAKLLDVARWAVPHFFKATADDLETLVPLGFELPYRAPIPDNRGRGNGLYHNGVIDVVWWDPEMQRLLIDDHKTVDELVGTTEKRIALDPQMSGYMHGAAYLVRTGKLKPMDGSELPDHAARTAGACRYNCIRRSHPKVPKVNKVAKNDGPVKEAKAREWPEVTAKLREMEKATDVPMGLVSAAAVDTTGELYEQALRSQLTERRLPVTEKQAELVRKLRGQGDRYFARFEFWRGREEREHWRQELWIEARRMREAEKIPKLRTRNPGACTQAGSMPCAYRAVCLDDSPETRALYRIADKRHEEIKNEQGQGQAEAR